MRNRKLLCRYFLHLACQDGADASMVRVCVARVASRPTFRAPHTLQANLTPNTYREAWEPMGGDDAMIHALLEVPAAVVHWCVLNRLCVLLLDSGRMVFRIRRRSRRRLPCSSACVLGAWALCDETRGVVDCSSFSGISH